MWWLSQHALDEVGKLEMQCKVIGVVEAIVQLKGNDYVGTLELRYPAAG